jgi:hypothetical protein
MARRATPDVGHHISLSAASAVKDKSKMVKLAKYSSAQWWQLSNDPK